LKATYLVCYDIANPRRLGRVFRFMKGRGMHVQYSVFRCRLTWPELQDMKRKLTSIINTAEDDVRIYPLPSDGDMVVAMGLGDRVPPGAEIYLD